jgi:hypothetical protein
MTKRSSKSAPTLAQKAEIARQLEGERKKTKAALRRAEGKTTPSGKVAAAQRKKASSDSPLKATATKKPPSKKNGLSPEQEKAIKTFADSPLGQAAWSDAKAAVEKKYPNMGKTTPSGSVAAKQRKKATQDSPLSSTPTTKPRSKKNEASPSVQRVEQRYNSRGDVRHHLIDERGVVASNPDGSRMRSYKTEGEANRALTKAKKQSGGSSGRKLSMDPKQVARRAKRGFPNGK